ncbi:hypothetical protein BXZ70DRAFT_1003522 [Cristinia sonorae]|uniref:Uncharacterized protein n=1 Tax=Cristinia sonorae TaxID=1940300 RepID=A0A8K0V2L8_9AGAR|nr:hypothetical protein BXZ70DRAFT_1003522 [Cristinia sonorae]
MDQADLSLSSTIFLVLLLLLFAFLCIGAFLCALLWEDCMLAGQVVEGLAPEGVVRVRKRNVKQHGRLNMETVVNYSASQDIAPSPSSCPCSKRLKRGQSTHPTPSSIVYHVIVHYQASDAPQFQLDKLDPAVRVVRSVIRS